jgi:aminoglycoside 6'-N-acetyltransferase I
LRASAAIRLAIAPGVHESGVVARRGRGKRVSDFGTPRRVSAKRTSIGLRLGTMQITSPIGSADSAWLALRLALWPDAAKAEHISGMADAIARGHYVRLAVAADGSALGFVEASKRVDYVNGTSSSPVAFVEGLYVVPSVRRQGLARTLVESVVKWALAEGCTELASDALIDNHSAHAVHRSLGFEEMERVVYFRRALHDP